MKVGVLTGGGDAPGLNAAIRAIVLGATKRGFDVVGIRCGWQGILEPDSFQLTGDDVQDIVRDGGTILGSSRTNPYKTSEGPKQALKGIKTLGLDALIAIGGDDTLGVAKKLHDKGVNIVGVPKTIDNDVSATDFCIGFDTASNIAAKSISDLHTTACSHRRIIVAEIMGRHAGWITLYAGIAGGAHLILLPEEEVDLNKVCKFLTSRKQKGALYSIVAVSEGIRGSEIDDKIQKREERDAFGNIILAKLGIGELLAQLINQKTGIETRAVVLGHLQRSGPPSAFDRVLGTRLGAKAIELVAEKQFGKMPVLRGTKIAVVDLEEGVARTRLVEKPMLDLVKLITGQE